MIVILMAALLLQPCPDKPNCVSTEAVDAHAIAPIRFQGTPAAAHSRLVEAIATIPRSRIVSDDGKTVRAEFTTLIFRFVDDAVFVIDAPSGTIHFRSASRVGHSDLGVNRRRMERIRAAFGAP
jgi:uncharacterized protein (DUF1499 family)